MQQIPVRHIQEPELSGSFSIRDLEKLLDGKDMLQELHRHDFFLIIALKSGSGQHDIDFKAYTIADHIIFFMRPGQLHKLVLKAGSTGYILQFSGDFYPSAAELLRRAGQQNHYQLSETVSVKLQHVLASIFEEHRDKQERFKEVIQANMSIFFTRLIRQLPPSSATAETRYRQERLDKFMTLLEQHILTQKQVSQYADMLNISTYQLNAITKELLGKTTSTLINEQIILEAKRCLLATSYQVNQIAYHMGYEDPSYFIRFFKKQTGYSPDAFRHNSG
ncbi:helix-turn-helix transcriptional regulator [Mucilaginibacter sp.]|uniref:helix-turn-helix domain-containing protein n=1 Tax=Mucilaginibacter sp. TaxID=1882438 RepID=UPI0032671248